MLCGLRHKSLQQSVIFLEGALFSKFYMDLSQQMLVWKLRKSEIENLKKENETTGRLNRNLWNHLTINAQKQTEITITRDLAQSNFVKTRYLWNHWITSIPGRKLSLDFEWTSFMVDFSIFDNFVDSARETSSNL